MARRKFKLINAPGFDASDDQTITGDWEFALPGAAGSRTAQVLITGNHAAPGLGVGKALLEINQNTSSGNTSICQMFINGTTRVFDIDNEGDMFCKGSISVGTMFMSNTYHTNYFSYNSNANYGVWLGTNSAHNKRGRLLLGNRPTQALDVLGADQDFDHLTITRKYDGDNTYSADGALIKLETNLVDLSSGATNFLECEDDTLGTVVTIDGSGDYSGQMISLAAGNHLELDATLARFKGESQALADDASGTWTIPDTIAYGMIFVVSTFNENAVFIGAYSGSTVATIHAGSLCDNGATANNDTDGQMNVWSSGSSTFNIKNRLGSSRSFTVYILSI